MTACARSRAGWSSGCRLRARCMPSPTLLLLDEPFAALDADGVGNRRGADARRDRARRAPCWPPRMQPLGFDGVEFASIEIVADGCWRSACIRRRSGAAANPLAAGRARSDGGHLPRYCARTCAWRCAAARARIALVALSLLILVVLVSRSIRRRRARASTRRRGAVGRADLRRDAGRDARDARRTRQRLHSRADAEPASIPPRSTPRSSPPPSSSWRSPRSPQSS